jgi:hypothetical protein
MKIVRLLFDLILHVGCLWVIMTGSYTVLMALDVASGVSPGTSWKTRVVLGLVGLIMVESAHCLECLYRQRKKKGG